MAKSKQIVGIQMYTVRDLAAADLPGTLKKLSQIGYKAVQIGGYPNMTPKQVRKMMDDVGLISAGTHLGVGSLTNDFAATVDLLKTIGSERAIVSSAPKENRDSVDGYKKFAVQMNAAVEKLEKEKLGLSYHNHSFEFAKFGDKIAYDILFEALSPKIHAEIDTYWIKHGGGDPVAFLKRFKGRMSTVHFKDMAKDEAKTMVPVGNGILDWPNIIKATQAGGAKWLVVEQDDCKPLAPMDAAKASFDNLKKWGLA